MSSRSILSRRRSRNVEEKKLMKGNSTKFSMGAAINSMAVRVADRELLIRSSRAKEIREETTIRTSRARAFIKEAKVAATRVERDLGRWQEIRVVEMVVADADYLCLSFDPSFSLS